MLSFASFCNTTHAQVAFVDVINRNKGNYNLSGS